VVGGGRDTHGKTVVFKTDAFDLMTLNKNLQNRSASVLNVCNDKLSPSTAELYLTISNAQCGGDGSGPRQSNDRHDGLPCSSGTTFVMRVDWWESEDSGRRGMA